MTSALGASSRTAWWRLALLAAAALLSIHSARAQFVRFERLGTEQGLGNLAVGAIGQDTDGAILVGTEGGLYRYDGAAFHPYEDRALSSAAWIHQILHDKADRLWLSTGDGVFVREGATLVKVAPVRLPNDQISADSLARAGASMALDVDGVIEIVPGGDRRRGVERLFDRATVARIPALDKAVFVAEDGDTSLLIGCGQQLCRGWGSSVATLGAADGLPDETWLAALHAPDGTIWARSLHHLVWRKAGDASFSVAALPGGTQSFFAGHRGDIDLVADGKGGIFTGSDEGLIQWTGHAWRVSSRHVGGLPPNIIHSEFLDREGSLWVGSEGGGVSHSLGLGLWEHWTADDGLPDNTVWSLAKRPDGTIWVATNRGTIELNGRHRRLEGSNYALAVSHKGRLWLAPMGQPIERLAGDGSAPEEFQLLPHDATDAVVDRSNRLWIATRNGIMVIDDADAPRELIRLRSIPSNGQILVALDTSGRVWAMEQTHLFRQGEGTELLPVRLPAGWPFRSADITFGHDGTLWLGTETGGVAHFRIDGDTLAALPSLMVPRIASNSVLSVRVDSRGWLWIGTDHGIDLLKGQSSARVDSSDGPISNDLDQDSILEGSDGSMWFGTSSGLSHLIEPGRLDRPKELHPKVTSITYGDHTASLGQALDTNWTSAPLVIRIDDFDYATGPLTFRYKLTGVDKHWTETTAREVRYANVPAGSLSFEMYAVDSSHEVVSKLVSAKVFIHPPWWRQWWFYVLVWLAGTGIIAAAWWWRMSFLVRQRAQLEELIRCRTAEIKAANDRLARQSALEQRRLEEMVDARTAEIELARQELQRLALSDVLTGLPNRRAVLSTLETWLATPREAGCDVGVLLLDVDHFKQVNDRFGHVAGDEVLARYGAKLASAVQADELAGRYGGEEFLVIFKGQRDLLRHRAHAVWAAVSGDTYVFGAQERCVTASAGFAVLLPAETDLALIERADAALYRAKEKGRARLELAPDVLMAETDDRAASAQEALPDLAGSLRQALARREFRLHFQPIVDVAGKTVSSCEALLRWESPALGPVAPIVFIPVAEALGLMPAIGAWVLREACREATSWPAHVGVSINLSPCQMTDAALVDRVAHTLRETGLAADRLELEVTESAIIRDIERARCILDDLRELGVSIALDDFGTGYSSLSFLHALAFDRIKIDKSFIKELGASRRSLTIVRSLVVLCRGLGARVTAEGVETDLQVQTLLRAGCRELQGYIFSTPRPADELRQ